jgi:undecaprenyl diphosphate synthase
VSRAPDPASSAGPRPDSAAGPAVRRRLDGDETGQSVPRHIAIIMDGNGRWAKARGLPRSAGHRAGAEAARAALRAAGEAGVECLTLYAFSSENWRRPAAEISELTALLRFYVKKELNDLHREGIRLVILGNHNAFEADVARMVDEAVAKTAGNDRMTLAVALNYGARSELVQAMRDLAGEVAAGRLRPEQIDEDRIETALDTKGLPPLDLLIRTSGEQRLSNFLLWQAAYSELYFTETLWPDFDEEAMRAALAEYGRRERRYGGL